MTYYSAKHKNKEIQKLSSSGGVFTALSNVFLEMGGIIVGGEYNYSTHEVEHRICRTFEERDHLRGSKYIQSNTNKIFSQIKNEIEKNKKILFVGTPCQITGLKSYLLLKHLNIDNITFCDLICHGVPSPAVWKQCIKKWKNAISFVTFKDKRLSWKQPLAFVTINNKKKSLRKYTLLYFGELISRPCCRECPYTSMTRYSDITIGDHWGVDSSFFDKNGISLIITNTKKGQNAFNEASKELIFVERTKDECWQLSLQHPSNQHPQRVKFWSLYDKHPDLAIYLFDLKIIMNKLRNKLLNRTFKKFENITPRSEIQTDSMNIFTDSKNKNMDMDNRSFCKPLPSLYEKHTNCCGCSACFSICPQKAITMESDKEGFLYPVINTSTCIKCYKCIEVCAFKKDQMKWSK